MIKEKNLQKKLASKKIHLDGTFNTRDFGGYRSNYGGYVKKDTLYRSDDLHALSQKDVMILEDMGVDTIIDYRNKYEILKRPNIPIKGALTYNYSPEDTIAEMASFDVKNDKDKIDALLVLESKGNLNSDEDLLKKSIISLVNSEHSKSIYRKVLELYSDSSTNIIIQHCRGGKDRTGYGVALVLLSLGVSENDVITDYMLTSEANKARNQKRMKEYEQYTQNKNVLTYLSGAMGTRQIVIETALHEMRQSGGSIEGYLLNILKLPESSLIKIRKKYLI